MHDHLIHLARRVACPDIGGELYNRAMSPTAAQQGAALDRLQFRLFLASGGEVSLVLACILQRCQLVIKMRLRSGAFQFSQIPRTSWCVRLTC